jgi:hypothetical protein
MNDQKRRVKKISQQTANEFLMIIFAIGEYEYALYLC